MRLSIRAKQVAGVTSIVGLAVVGLGALYVSAVARVQLEASQAAGRLLANAIYHRARVVAASSPDPYDALGADPGLRSILEASAYSPNVTYAAIVDPANIAVAHSDTDLLGQILPPRPALEGLLARGAWTQLRTIYAGEASTLEIQQPLLMGEQRFGTIRIGVSTLLTRADVGEAIRPAVVAAIVAVFAASLVAMLLARSLLRPIHLIRAGLSRLGRGEFGVHVDVTGQDEFGDLGGFVNSLSAQLSATRARIAGPQPTLESLTGRLEDALAVFTPTGELAFANDAMNAVIQEAPAPRALANIWPARHPYRLLVERTLADSRPVGPVVMELEAADLPSRAAERLSGAAGRRLVATHPLGGQGAPVAGVILVVRDLDDLAEVESTLRHARQLAALSRLSAGVAHEIKNPLNAIAIHLELLAQQIAAPAPDGPPGADLPAGAARPADDHVEVIRRAIRRLDEVLQGYLKFTRPEDLHLQPVQLSSLVADVLPIVDAEARRSGIDVRVDCPADLPEVPGDPGMLQQAVLNLALNACQAMPDGGRLRIAARAAPHRMVELLVEDSGAGIAPEHLGKVFDLYFTTKPGGSGMGLPLVYRTIRLHDGEIEVDSSPGSGAVFRVLLPCVPASPESAPGRRDGS